MSSSSLRWWSWLGIAALAVLVAIQLVPYGRQPAARPTLSEPAWDSPATRVLAKQACFDCHSNETVWPPYARVAPVSWLIQYDVNEGRAALNFSEWQRPQKEADEAAKAIHEGEMPPAVYRLMHAPARLSPGERERLAHGLATTIAASPGEADQH